MQRPTNPFSQVGRDGAALALLVGLAAGPLAAQPSTGTLAGTVESHEAETLADAVVEVVDTNQVAVTDADGKYRFEAVPAGSHVVQATSDRGGTAVARVEIRAGETTELDLHTERSVHSEQIVVTAGPEARRQLELAQPTTVLSAEELDVRSQPSLGETLSDQPGISSSYFGPGASRPVIRGLGGERIRTLSNGLGTSDASNTSPDHAVSVEPLVAERIEVLRGPATLLYGSSAIGGVVNVIDERIPETVPQSELSGSLELSGGTVSDERAGGAAVGGRLGDRWAWHADFFSRETDDYEIPGRAELEHENHEEHEVEEDPEHDEESAIGILENSALDNQSGAFGLSWVGERGFVGVAVSGLESLYGVPGHAHEEAHESEEGEESIRIDLEQRRVDLRTEVSNPLPGFRGLKARLGVSDYEHTELEGDEVGTRFLDESVETRVELVQQRRGSWTGSVGLQAGRTDFEAIGEEAFVPPSVTEDFALFTFQEIESGSLRYQLGARVEHKEVDPEGTSSSRSFDGVSASAGLVWLLDEDLSLSASLSRAERLPSATELFAEGPHVATRTFEVGDPGLESEVANGFELGLKTEQERFRGSITAYYNRFDDYIFGRFTGEEEDGFDVIRYEQEDAEFLGGEVDLLFRVVEIDGGHLDFTVQADTVRAELMDSGEPLPRIPPVRYGAGLAYHREQLRVSVEGRRSEEQDRVAVNEEPTAGYTLWNASVGYSFFFEDSILEVTLRGRNLTDEEARPHTSFLKELAPLPGRDFGLVARWTF